MTINWDDPVERAHLIERIGVEAYNEAARAHQAASVIATVNGYPIRPVASPFGRLFAVDGAGRAFKTLDAAKTYAEARS